jgi:hypothetical protein
MRNRLLTLCQAADELGCSVGRVRDLALLVSRLDEDRREGGPPLVALPRERVAEHLVDVLPDEFDKGLLRSLLEELGG